MLLRIIREPIAIPEELYSGIAESITEFARGANCGGRPLEVKETILTSEKKQAEAVQNLLKKRAFACLNLGQSGQRAQLQAGDIVVTIDREDDAFYVVVARADSIHPSDLFSEVFFQQPCYVFHAKDFATDDPYAGKNYRDVRAMVAAEHGESSEHTRGVDRVIELTRRGLYETVDHEQEDEIFGELRELVLRFGAAAYAVMYDLYKGHEHALSEKFETIQLGNL